MGQVKTSLETERHGWDGGEDEGWPVRVRGWGAFVFAALELDNRRARDVDVVASQVRARTIPFQRRGMEERQGTSRGRGIGPGKERALRRERTV